MSRKSRDDCTFRQRDVKEAIKAARNAGLENFRVDIDKHGTISIVPMTPSVGTQRQGTPNKWDDVLHDK